MNELVLGTHNQKKRAELEQLLAPIGIELRTLADFEQAIQVVEDGDSFQANATKKAVQQAVHLGCWVLGEDSGLEVDALNGAPGIYSARFAGTDGDDEANNAHLLRELRDVARPKRTARYVCHMTLSDPSGQVRADCESTCSGRIRFDPSGENGFGYDPLFEIVEYGHTFGELGSAVKSVISHRAKAMRQFVRLIASID